MSAKLKSGSQSLSVKLLNNKPFLVSTKFTRKAHIGQNWGYYSNELQITNYSENRMGDMDEADREKEKGNTEYQKGNFR